MHHRLEPPGEDVGVGNPPAGVLFQELAQDAFQFFGRVGRVLADRLRLLEPLFVQHLGQRLAAKHRPPGQQGVHQRPQAVEVGPPVDRPALGLLRGHVFGGAQHAARAGQPRVPEEPRNAEVGQLHVVLGRHQQIAGLDVAVDHAAVVGVAQCAAGLDADPRHLAPLETPPAPQFLLETVAVDQLHRIEQVALLLAEAEEPDDVGVVEFAERFDLGLEAAAKTLLLGQGGREEFDGGRLARLAVDRLVDRSHAAAAKLADDLIGTKPFDFHERGVRGQGSGIRDRDNAPRLRSRGVLNFS